MSHRNVIQNGVIPSLGRREILKSASAGFGYLALAGLMGQGIEKRSIAADSNSPTLLYPRPAHRHSGPPRGRDSAPHRGSPGSAHPTLHGFMAIVWSGNGKSGSARICDYQSGSELRRNGQLRQCLSTGPLSGHEDQRCWIFAEREGTGPIKASASPAGFSSRLKPGFDHESLQAS